MATKHISPLTDAANAVFVRQQDDYSCGAACLATVARIYDVTGADYDRLRNELLPDPSVGTSNADMETVSRRYLPVTSAGERSYTGGIAIANILEDEGHYVVFLCRERDQVIYYDPYDHALVQDDIKNIRWVSEAEKSQEWAINFPPLAGNSIRKWQMTLPKAGP